MNNLKVISIAVFVYVMLQSSVLMADQGKYRGKVLKVNGDVEVINEKGDKRFVKSADEPLNEMDTIVTREGARIVMQFDDGALSVLDEKSRMRVEKTSWFSYLGGKVYFTFKRAFGEPRRVKTRAATIGIRGTTFVIAENAEQNGESVALKEGLLDVESTGPAFEIHKPAMMNEFAQFRQAHKQANDELRNEFEQYRRQTRREFVEYRHRFTLQPNRVINMSGYRIDETAMTADGQADFASFEAEAEELIKAFRARSSR